MTNTLATLALWFVTVSAPFVPSPAPVRVIMNRGAGLESVSLPDLARMFRGEIGSLPNGVRIVLAEQVSARGRFYADVIQMSEDTFRRHWIRVVFAGNPVAAPVPFTSTEAIVSFVARTPGAIGFTDGSPDDTVQVLRVDQKRVDDPSYPIH